MKLTVAQYNWLKWFKEHGGLGIVRASRVCCGDDPSNQSNTSASLPFLALVAHGAVEGHEGKLRITQYGLRLVDPWCKETSPSPQER